MEVNHVGRKGVTLHVQLAEQLILAVAGGGRAFTAASTTEYDVAVLDFADPTAVRYSNRDIGQ
jgi:hypothetical protein